MRSALPRACTVLLILAFASSPLHAGSSRSIRGEEDRSFFAAVWQLVGSLLPAIEKARGSMDPDGQPAPEPSPTTDSDARGSMDPDGHT